MKYMNAINEERGSMKTTSILGLMFLAIFLIGCSGPSTPVDPGIEPSAGDSMQMGNHCNWGFWQFRFSADHTQLEVVPQRRAEYHYCVTKFVEEWPCDNCLKIGQPHVQPDATVKLNVTLKHPFPNVRKYTGFDVRGMVYFPPTKVQDTYLEYQSHIYDDNPGAKDLFPIPPRYMPLAFSRADQGGGELLNADGYSCYLIPGLTYSLKWPIFSYSPPKHSNEPTPIYTTINPYKLFASETGRRMFLVSYQITREYHFALPPGPFNFGYAVDASWWPPDNTPVTNPAVDFPREANAEDPWLIEYEQLLPIKEENVGKDIFKVTVHHRGTESIWNSYIYAWGLSGSSSGGKYPQFSAGLAEVIDDYTTVGYLKLGSNWWYIAGDHINPGHHLGVLVVTYSQDGSDPKTELRFIYGPRFVDIYIEG
jgi:hypothetical protein